MENLFRFRIRSSLFLIKACCKPCLPKPFRLCHPCRISLLLLLCGNDIPYRHFLRCPDFQRLPPVIRFRNRLFTKHQFQRILLLNPHHCLCPAYSVKCPYPDIAKAKCHPNFSVRIRNHHCSREKLCHIQDFNRNMRSCSRFSILILHKNLHQLRSAIKICMVKVVQRPFFSKILLVTLLYIIREVPRMNQNCPIRRTGEPAGIQHFFRLTGAKEMPLAVHKHLNPRMIVITVRPSWCIDLPRRNTNTPIRRNCKRRLLAAASLSTPIHCHRRCRSAVRRLIRRMLRTPVINLQNRL